MTVSTSTSGLRYRIHRRVQQRDPENDALRRAVRAALVVPLAGALGFAIAGDSPQTPLYTIFGSVALLVFSDFPGNRQNRAVAYAGLGLIGFGMISLGTLVAHHPWPAVLTMFCLGVVVTFSGVFSETLAAGQRATLLTFVLPACTPPAPLGDRLLGWTIALAVCVPAALFVLPPHHHGELRRHAARACRALADRLDGRGTAAAATAAMDALRANFLGAAFRPVGLTAGSRALVRVVDDLEWVTEGTGQQAGAALADMKDPAVRVLRDAASVLRISRVARRDAARAELDAALAELRTASGGRYREDLATILDAVDDEHAVELGRQLLRRRTIAATIGATGRIIAAAAAADARPVWARALDLQLPQTGASDRLLPSTVVAAQITSGFLTNRAVAVRNSLRTGLGLGLAVAVTEVFTVENAFWVVLGALSVLRSSALTTGTRVWRAVIGTGIGFLLGVVVISLVGVDPVVLWLLMPLVVFGSAYVPEIASFTAAQAAFTMMVLIFFNLVVPTGWQVGLIRVQDVVVGALVAVVVSVLLWPRGATAAVTRAIGSARSIFSRYLRVAVLRITRGDFEERTDELVTLSHDALAASRVIDDAVRQYLSEGSGETDFRTPTVSSFNRAIRLRTAADLIADIPTPPPLSAYPKVRAVVEFHVDAICGRLAGRPQPEQPWTLIADDFVLALRSEAPHDDLGVAAALPLLTVAALLGELESIFPLQETP
ncbi:fusaric acid resistance protein [Mycolicibacterium cyprinidarum]|uniref:Fusaric acid resistance protein n=1 Tax=Mycolicibacterium cyprinidarum TaxID=2860311 RepID=A0ABQ4VAM0_9MYCO|nr:fusaric acid resistance protein [Mycolicibacterium sp. NGTWSNA01]GJF16430.1 fusaric acid resistance protein [Mycolicibacterium sp. NGTWS0302]